MRKTVEFLDAVKAKQELESDYALAKWMQVSFKRISNYRTGRSHFDGEMCLRVEKILGMPEGYVSSCIEAERAKVGPVQKMWRHVAEVLSEKAAAVFLIALSPALLAAFRELCILCKMRKSLRFAL